MEYFIIIPETKLKVTAKDEQEMIYKALGELSHFCDKCGKLLD